jgi:lipopolysaccharide cholinephosphotransferase
MKKINDFHKELLVLLKDLDSICVKNNIKYSLFGGTMIGAIRHKGFIPWDDDADIIFERNQYEKLLKVLPQGFSMTNPWWIPRFQMTENERIYLDVFVFDKIPNSKQAQKLQILKLKAIQGLFKKKITTSKGLVGTIVSAITYLIGRFLSLDFKVKLYQKTAKKYNEIDSDFIFSSLDQFSYISHILPKSILSSYKKVEFEDTQLMILEGYDTYLKKFYGDYMALPPEKDRRPIHGNLK